MNDIFEEVADYRDLEQRLFKYTNAWTRESGEFPLKMKSERENADAILSKHYYNVDDHHLDYDDIHVDGTNYKIIFSDPKEANYDDIEESRKKKEDEIKIMPNYDVTKGPIANGGLGDAPVVAAESLDEDVDNIHLRDVLNNIKTIYVYNDIDDFHYYESLEEDLPWEEDILSMSDDWIKNNVSRDELVNVKNVELLNRIAKIDKNKLTRDQLELLKKLYKKKTLISREDVQDLINKFKDCDRLILAQRPKNNSFIEKYDLSSSDCLDIIHNLKVSDYASSTRNYNLEHLGNNLIIFEPKNIKLNDDNVDVNIYVKLDIDESIDLSIAAVSFHEAKYDNRLPYEGENVMEEKSNVFNTLVEGYTLTEEENREEIVTIDELKDHILNYLSDCELVDAEDNGDSIAIYFKDEAIKQYAPTVPQEVIDDLLGGIDITFDRFTDVGANYNKETNDYEDADTLEVRGSLGDDFSSFYFYPLGDEAAKEHELASLDKDYLELFSNEDVINTLQGIEKDYGNGNLENDIKEESIEEGYGDLDACKIGEDIEALAMEHHVYPELQDCEEGPMGCAIVSFDLNGDWKHEHLYFESLVDDYCANNGLVVFNSKNEEVGESDSDYYESIHTFYIIKQEDEEKLNAMRGAFSVKESLTEAEEDNVGYVVGNFIRDEDGDIVDFEDLSPWDRINKTTDLTDQRMFTDEDEAIEFAKNHEDVSVVLKVEYEHSDEHDIDTILTLPDEAEVVWSKESLTEAEEDTEGNFSKQKLSNDIKKVSGLKPMYETTTIIRGYHDFHGDFKVSNTWFDYPGKFVISFRYELAEETLDKIIDGLTELGYSVDRGKYKIYRDKKPAARPLGDNQILVIEPIKGDKRNREIPNEFNKHIEDRFGKVESLTEATDWTIDELVDDYMSRTDFDNPKYKDDFNAIFDEIVERTGDEDMAIEVISRLTDPNLTEGKLNEWEDNGYKQHVWAIIDEADRDKVVDILGEPEGEGDWEDGKYVLDYYFDDLDSARDFADNIPGDIEWDEEELDEAVLGSLDTPAQKDAAKRAFERQARKEADAKSHAEYKKHPSKFDIKADK